MTITDTTATVTTEAVRATWKQHGRPTAGFEFFGTEVKAASAKGRKVAKVRVDSQGVTLLGGNNRPLEGGTFAPATKFWAVVPEDAERQAEPVKPPKAERTPAAPIEITAPKGGDQTVPPIKGAIAKAIEASGKSLNAISREHGLNPSQMRRLVLNQVAKVDLVRAEAIAKALGVEVSKLFGAPVDKAAVKANGNGTTPAPADQPAEDAEAAKAEAAEDATAEHDSAAKSEA